MSNQGRILPFVELGTGCAASARANALAQKPAPPAIPSSTGGGRRPLAGTMAVASRDAQESKVMPPLSARPQTCPPSGTDETVTSQMTRDMFASCGPVDTTGLTHAELMHHFWYFFRHQVAALQETMRELRQDVGSLQVASGESTSSSTEAPMADMEKRLVKVSDAVQTSDKSWKEEVARLSKEVEAIRATSTQELGSGLHQLDADIRRELAALRAEWTPHAKRLDALQEKEAKCEETLDTLRLELSEASKEHRRNHAELRESLPKALSDLSIKLQTELVQCNHKFYLHVEEETTRLQVAFEGDHQALRTDMEQSLKESCSMIRENHHALAGSVRILDSKLREVIAEACRKHRAEVAELVHVFPENLRALRTSSEESLAYLQTLISGMSNKQQSSYSSISDRCAELDHAVIDASRETAAVRRRVEEMRSIPLIRGALSQP